MRMICVACVPVLLLAGCTKNQEPAKVQGPSPVLTLVGPGGKISIDDPIEQAVTAFPAPANSDTFNSANTIGFLGTSGWGWGLKVGDGSFEVASEFGKVTGLVRSVGKAPEEPDKSISELGPPTKRADGKTASLCVWKSGPIARCLMTLKPNNPAMPG